MFNVENQCEQSNVHSNCVPVCPTSDSPCNRHRYISCLLDKFNHSLRDSEVHNTSAKSKIYHFSGVYTNLKKDTPPVLCYIVFIIFQNIPMRSRICFRIYWHLTRSIKAPIYFMDSTTHWGIPVYAIQFLVMFRVMGCIPISPVLLFVILYRIAKYTIGISIVICYSLSYCKVQQCKSMIADPEHASGSVKTINLRLAKLGHIMLNGMMVMMMMTKSWLSIRIVGRISLQRNYIVGVSFCVEVEEMR